MRRFEQSVLVLLILSIAVFIFNHERTYFSIMMWTGLVLAISYFLFGPFIFKSKEKKFNPWLIPFGIIFSLSTFSLLFKVLFLFGWEPMNWFALAGTCLSLILTYFLAKKNKIGNHSKTKLYKASFIWLSILVITLLIPQKTYVEKVFKEYPEMISAFEKYTNNTENREARDAFVKEYYKFQDDFQEFNKE